MMLRAADNARLGFAIGLAGRQAGRQAGRLLTGMWRGTGDGWIDEGWVVSSGRVVWWVEC